MGKMIDAQSICVATAGTNQVGRAVDRLQDLEARVAARLRFLGCPGFA